MINEQNITLSEIEKYYSPNQHDTVDAISNLPDQHVAYYACLLQDELNRARFRIGADENVFKNPFCLLVKPLSVIECAIAEPKLSCNIIESNPAKNFIDEIEKNDKKSEIIKSIGQVGYDKILMEAKEASKKPIIIRNYELFFKVYVRGIQSGIVLRNGFILKSLMDSGAELQNIDKYRAVVVYNQADINPHTSAFVKFTQ